jgi:hypothetical protein
MDLQTRSRQSPTQKPVRTRIGGEIRWTWIGGQFTFKLAQQFGSFHGCAVAF